MSDAVVGERNTMLKETSDSKEGILPASSKQQSLMERTSCNRNQIRSQYLDGLRDPVLVISLPWASFSSSGPLHL